MADDRAAIMVELRYIRQAQDRLLDGQSHINGRVRANEVAIAEVKSEAKSAARIAGAVSGGITSIATTLTAIFGIGR